MKIKMKELRKKKGWTQAKTAIESGLSLDYIRSLEIGRASPSLQTAIQLKAAFGCNSVEELIDDAM